MHQVEVDGVPVVWQHAPGPLRASLLFRVGRRDETFVTGGITHLVEHLAMGALGRTHLDCNATVELGVTSFTATGREDAVVEFLARICAALSDLPTDRLATEASVVRAENSVVDHPAIAILLACRYGARGVGLAGFDEPALSALTAGQVRAHAGRYFVRGNAALTLTGPPPAALNLPLPDGGQQSLLPGTPLPLLRPTWSDHPLDGVALGMTGPDVEALATGARILRNRLEDDLRHHRGLAYDIGWGSHLIRPDQAHIALHLDPRTPDVPTVARASVQALRALAEAGPTEEDLAHDLSGFSEFVADERTIPDALDAYAADLLAGRPPLTAAQRLHAREQVTGDQVRAAVQEAVGSLQLLVHEQADLDAVAEGVHLVREPRSVIAPVTGRTLRRRLFSDAPRGSSLTIGDQGLTLQADGVTTTVRFADLVGVARHPEGFYCVTGVDGLSIPVDAADWKDGEAAVALLRRHAPDHFWFDSESD